MLFKSQLQCATSFSPAGQNAIRSPRPSACAPPT
uniref:Uncharacterized protein n=1 Tax=Anguilla anguilla TaxID=7936 RepID=A0A0E9Q2M7_ANGAN